MRSQRPSALLAGIVLATGLVAGACGGGSSNRATTGTTSAPSPSATPAAPSGSGQGAVTSSDLKPIDDATKQLDSELGSADQGLNTTEGDPTQ
jgi:hypothetical protein